MKPDRPANKLSNQIKIRSMWVGFEHRKKRCVRRFVECHLHRGLPANRVLNEARWGLVPADYSQLLSIGLANHSF